MNTTHFSTRPRPLAQAGWVMLFLFLALALGLASALLPAWFLVAALLVPAVAVLVLVRPELGLLAMIAFACGLVHPAIQPRIPLFGGALSTADATLAMLVLYALGAWASQGQLPKAAPVQGARRMAIALSLFGVCLLIAVPLSLFYRDLNPTFVLAESRHFLYLLTLPVAVIILRQPERQRRFVIGIVVLGCLFSVGQVLQGVFNIEVFGVASRLVVLETLGREEHGTTRTLTLGIGVVIWALLLIVGANLLGLVRKPVFFAVAGLLLLGITLTFGRTTYAVAAVGLLMVVWWLNLKKLPQLVGLFVLFVALGSATVGLLRPQSLEAAYYRLTSIGTEVASGYSAQGRLWEFDAMLPRIEEQPLTGIGLGADYISRKGISSTSALDRYVHNTYLFIAGKLGLPALTFWLAAVAAIFVMGRRLAKAGHSPGARVIGAAGAAMMGCYVLAAVTEPHFHSDYSLVVIASVGALVYLSARRALPSPAADAIA